MAPSMKIVFGLLTFVTFGMIIGTHRFLSITFAILLLLLLLLLSSFFLF